MHDTHPEFTSPVRDCLVGVVTSDRDLACFRDHRWYRIPDRTLGRTLSPRALEESRYLALYQTSGIQHGLQSAIEYWGEIIGISSMPRRELIPDEPDHPAADEVYHRVRVASIHRLERPIVTLRPRRLSFIRTTGEHLRKASFISDLFVGTAVEEKLWRALKARSVDAERKFFMQVGGSVLEVDFAVFGGDGRGIGVLCAGGDGVSASTASPSANAGDMWRLMRFSPTTIERDAEECVRHILDAIGQMQEVRSHGLRIISAGPIDGITTSMRSASIVGRRV